MATFPMNIWLAIIASLLLIVVMIIMTIFVYMSVNPEIVRMDLSVSHIIIRLVAGFTEPDDGSWFKTFSTGTQKILPAI